MDAVGDATHRIPVIDKMMQVLLALEATPAGLSVARLSRDLKLSRTTVYRMLNTLEDHGVVARANGDGAFALGPTLLRLSRGVAQPPDIATASRATIEALAARIGQTVKISVRDGGEALVVAVALGPGAFSISAQVGRRFPLHAGAASKLLLAFAAQQDVEAYLSGSLTRHTESTIVDPTALKRELALIRARNWAEDRGEFVPGVRAIAAPIQDAARTVVAALSVTLIAGPDDETPDIVREVRASAETLSRSLGF